MSLKWSMTMDTFPDTFMAISCSTICSRGLGLSVAPNTSSSMLVFGFGLYVLANKVSSKTKMMKQFN